MPLVFSLSGSFPKSRRVRGPLGSLGLGPRLGSLGLALLLGQACSDSPGAVGSGSDVFAARASLESGPALGGMGGANPDGGLAGGAGEGGADGGSMAEVCTPGVYLVDGLPECFVAELSTAEQACDAEGREQLSEARENRARQDECAFRGLEGAACNALSVCGVTKLEGADALACQTNAESPSGFCLLSAQASCPASSENTLRVIGLRAGAEALQVYCAIEDREDVGAY